MQAASFPSYPSLLSSISGTNKDSLFVENDPFRAIFIENITRWGKTLCIEERPQVTSDLIRAYDERAESFHFSDLSIRALPPLPPSVCHVVIKNCPYLAKLDHDILCGVSKLELENCSSLFSFPTNLNLTELSIRECLFLSLSVADDSELTRLTLIDCVNLTHLRSLPAESLMEITVINCPKLTVSPTSLLNRCGEIQISTDQPDWIEAIVFRQSLNKWANNAPISENRHEIVEYIQDMYTTRSKMTEIRHSMITELPPIPMEVNQLIVKDCPGITAVPFSVLARTEVLSDNTRLYQNIRDAFEKILTQKKAYSNTTIQQLIFDHNLMEMLAVFSSGVESLMTTSVTRDMANHAAPEIIKQHESEWIHDQYDYHFSQPESIRLAIQHASGDCDHMACICKGLLDLYLADALRQLGYEDVSIQTWVMKAKPPGSHYLVMAQCSWNEGAAKIALIDPWNKGTATHYMHGLELLRARTPDTFTHSNIVFEYSDYINSHLEDPSARTALESCFEEHGMKEKIDAWIQTNTSHFIDWVDLAASPT